MNLRGWKRTTAGTLLLAANIWMLATNVRAEDGSQYFVYVSDKRVVTLEILLGKNRTILNYINLDDVIELIEAPALLIIDASGRSYHGHLIKNEEPDSEGGLYSVTDLVKPKQYRGYDILGDFRFQTSVKEAYLRLGSRILRLEALSKVDFEVEAAKIGQLDLSAEPRLALEDVGFWRGFGDIYFPESDEANRLEPEFPGAGPIPPVLLANPAPRLTAKWRDLPDPVTARLKAFVTAQGALTKLEPLDGGNPELSQQAIETVRNSWVFLPAIAEGAPAGAELTLNVVFER